MNRALLLISVSISFCCCSVGTASASENSERESELTNGGYRTEETVELLASKFSWSESEVSATRFTYQEIIMEAGEEIAIELERPDQAAAPALYLLEDTEDGTLLEAAFSKEHDPLCAAASTCLRHTNGRKKRTFYLVLRPPIAQTTQTYEPPTYRFSAIRNGNGERTSGQLKAGGFLVRAMARPRDAFQTVLVNDGATATELMRFDYREGRYVFGQWDRASSGTRRASRVSGGTKVDKANSQTTEETAQLVMLMIGVRGDGAKAGAIRLVRNDVAYGDADGDGLGNQLELASCTCPGGSFALPADCNWNCQPTEPVIDPPGPRDSDGDGLMDSWEILGIDGPSPLLFPAWGADPRHKDVFVEMDTLAGQPQTFNEGSAILAAARYKNLGQQNNPDGMPGVNVHFDLGIPCTAEDPPTGGDGVSSVCGMFGGASMVSSFNCAGVSDSDGNMAGIRRRKFHWALRSNTNAGNGQLLGSHFCHSGSWEVVSHELGHNLGIQHFGDESSGRINTKPNYPSLMSYTYQNNVMAAFSDGSRSSFPAHPLNARERDAFPAGVNVAFMGLAPHFYDLRTEASGATSIDWNRDGQFASTPVQAHIAGRPRNKRYGGEDIGVLQGNAFLPKVNTWVTPAAEMFQSFTGTHHGDGDRKTFVVVNDQDTGQFRYSTIDNDSNDWSDWKSVGRDAPRSAIEHTYDCEPEVIRFRTKFGIRLVVFGCSDRGLRITLMDQEGEIQNPFTGTGFPWVPFDSLFLIPRGVAATRANGYLYFVARGNLGESKDDVFLAALDFDMNTYGWRFTSVPGEGKIKSGKVTPALTTGPDGKLYLAVRQTDTLHPRFGKVDIYTFSPDGKSESPLDGRWEHLPASRWQASPRDTTLDCEVGGKIGMLYKKHKDVNGMDMTTGRLLIWHMGQAEQATDDCYRGTNLYYRMSFGPFDGDPQSNWNMGTWWNAVLARWNGPLLDTGVAMVDRQDNIAVFAIARGTDGGFLKPTEQPVLYIPYADGIAPIENPVNDFNDEAQIAKGTCESLHPPSWCH